MEEEWPKNVTWWNKIEPKTAELALHQTETELAETVKTAQSIQDRADKLLSLLTPAIFALLTYLVTLVDKPKGSLYLTAAILFLFLVAALVFVFLNIRPYTIRIPGNLAETYINDNFISNETKGDDQYLPILLQVCSDYKYRIGQNNLSNKTRSGRNLKAIKITMWGLFLSPILAITLHLLCVNCF
ncbi:hypothetical protein KXD93_16675 [Mucilaginibacter sp. BJC16-A38]|uniref:hypothetical protein n=1 Tax=Mucilaginibacter phenanthrenivorans TaxID=1234842 RepID=UPI002157AB07|nr:hypothetical protein [Mucilaginibacter phenanthrenivorans]MCR8559294.1 hypothetical protein [Mucilaginibacter phenanthrenivorans]